MIEFVRSNGIEPLLVPELVAALSLRRRDLIAIYKIYRILKHFRPHVVATHTAKAGFIGRLAAKLAGVPVIVHTYHGHILRGYYSSMVSSLLCAMERTLSRISDCLIAVSPLVKKDLVDLRIASERKIAVVPLGLELNPFLQSDGLKGQFRSDLNVENSCGVVGIVGRMVPIKNHLLFFDAAKLVSAVEPDTRFVVVGDGPTRRIGELRVQSLGISKNVIFTGWRRDLPRIYADLDVLVVSSLNEGTPVSAIEAMAAARPVIATSVGGVPDLIDNGRTGVLVESQNPRALAEAILGLLHDRAQSHRIGVAARIEAGSRYSSERMLADVRDLYRSLLVCKGVTGSSQANRAC